MFKKLFFEFALKIISVGSMRLRNRWAQELKKKGLLVLLPLVLCTCCGCSDSFKLWYVKTYDAVCGVKQPKNIYNLDDCRSMFEREPRLRHITLGDDLSPTIKIKSYDAGGVRFETETFGTKRNNLEQAYETLVLCRFKDGSQKVCGTSWPAADSRSFKDKTHSFKHADRFMIVLNRGRVNKAGKIIGKAQLIEFSKVVIL